MKLHCSTTETNGYTTLQFLLFFPPLIRPRNRCIVFLKTAHFISSFKGGFWYLKISLKKLWKSLLFFWLLYVCPSRYAVLYQHSLLFPVKLMTNLKYADEQTVRITQILTHTLRDVYLCINFNKGLHIIKQVVL